MNNSNQKIVIIDYGMGNIGSICNMFKYLGSEVTISSDYDTIKSADKLVLPGVGKFDKAIQNINKLGLQELIQTKALKSKTPILGICLGMHLMCQGSEEGNLPGLSLIKAKVKKFTVNELQKLKVPHMGWNNIEISKQSNILENSDDNSRFYFVHSYYVDCENDNDVLTYTNYGRKFVSSFQRENVTGVQFHPEKSHRYGMNLLNNFINNI
jgi:imidazole glycerol-phosphate synthase subunit HisH